jgi:DNA polymerase kappa
MPGYIAKKLCPELLIVPLRFEAYKEASRAMQAVLARFDPNFTACSLDEACVDLTDYLEGTKR